MLCCKTEGNYAIAQNSEQGSVNGKLFTILTQTINVLWCTCNYFYNVMHS
jgi:hypothetical protein